jgi:hypothetical protein
MTKRESDTSACETGASGDSAASTDDGATTWTNQREAQAPTDRRDALFDALVEERVLAVGDDGGVRTTDAFDDTHAVYHDSYAGVADDEFREAVAASFGLPDAEVAADLVAERDVSRDEFVVYLAVRSHLERDCSAEDLAAMAGMVWEVVPDSPVPTTLADVTDDPRSFLAGRDRAVVTVWKRFCDPCESVKDDLQILLDAVPDGVPVAGIDGEAAAAFCRTHDVESAPGLVLVAGDDRRTVCGSDTDAMVDEVRTLYEE